MKNNFILKIIHFIFNFHFLTGWDLINVDSLNYPYCKICGVKPKENYSFKWYSNKYIKIRRIILKYEK